ncbi:MAG: putative toxin-antitoxin system toxin component, PIN family [Elusimicrobia bacterium RIFCSPLOWO2_12_FULL_59_9]|nr:MAG: putative toxin-antitoxin system toxin component, PIN family [Elusimicrobia bacterium RIFCSPLOWO2_12_FULL_59_9]
MRIVLDTNVLVSAALYPRRPMGRILLLAADGRLQVFVSPFVLWELERVLARPKIGFEPGKIRETLEALKEVAHVVQPKTKVDVIASHEPDNRILECALAAKADVLVTGDLKDIRPLGRFEGIEILTPREFLYKYFPPT